MTIDYSAFFILERPSNPEKMTVQIKPQIDNKKLDLTFGDGTTATARDLVEAVSSSTAIVRGCAEFPELAYIDPVSLTKLNMKIERLTHELGCRTSTKSGESFQVSAFLEALNKAKQIVNS